MKKERRVNIPCTVSTVHWLIDVCNKNIEYGIKALPDITGPEAAERTRAMSIGIENFRRLKVVCERKLK